MSDIHDRLIAFTRGVPPAESFPVAELEECYAAALDRDAAGVLQYGHQPGYLPLREYLAEEYSAHISEVMVSNGSLQIQDLLAGCFVRPGMTVIVEQPSYDRSIAVFRRHGARVVGVPLEADGLDVGRLEELLKRDGAPAFLYVIPDFQNPTGITMSLEKRQRVLELADRYGFLILEDVPYRKLRYRGEQLPMLRELDPTHVIMLSSYSKLISPGMRVGFAVGGGDIIADLVQLAEDSYLAPVLPTQATVYEFEQRGLLAPRVEQLLALYRPRLAAAVAACRKHLPEAKFAPPDGGFFVGLTLPADVHLADLAERARRVGLALTPGHEFFADADVDAPGVSHGDRFVRLPFCALQSDEIEEGVRRLAKSVRS